MLRRIAIGLIIVVAGSMIAGTADARRRHSHRCHAVFARTLQRPVRAAVHALFLQRAQSRPLYSRDRLSLWREPATDDRERAARDDEAKYQKPDHDLDNIGDLFAALRSCWTPPQAEAAKEGMQMTVRFSFKRSGDMIGPPRMTFATAGVPADVRDTYFKAITSSLDACVPLKFTGGLGGAAGRTADRDPLCR